eukprot:gene3262-4085_t
MWKRKKDIEGVSSSSIISLKATVSNEERELKSLLNDDGTINRPKKLLKIEKNKQIDKKSNQGVALRNQRDLDQIKEEEKTFEKSQQSLIKKSKIYKDLVNRNPLEYNEDNDNQYRQNREQQQQQQQQQQQFSNSNYQEKLPEHMNHPDFERERMRRVWEQEIQNDEENEHIESVEQLKKEERIKEMLKESENTRINREKVISSKEQSKQQQNERLEMINRQKKLALLKQSLKEKQSKTTTTTPSSSKS